jgi:hypothetical protein
MTTLLLAAQLGPNPRVMNALLDAGADPSLVDKRGNTLLHCVAMNTKPGGPERLKTALSVTRTLDTRNTSGLSALDLARKYRNASVAAGLMTAGQGKRRRNRKTMNGIRGVREGDVMAFGSLSCLSAFSGFSERGHPAGVSPGVSGSAIGLTGSTSGPSTSQVVIHKTRYGDELQCNGGKNIIIV